MSVVIRKAELADVPWMLTELERLAAFYGTKLSLFGPRDMASAIVEDVLTHAATFIAEDAGTPIGLVAGIIVGHPDNPLVLVLAEKWFWVVEDRRGSRAASLLLDAFQAHGQAFADWTSFGAIVGKTRLTSRSLARRGFHQHEVTYLRENAV